MLLMQFILLLKLKVRLLKILENVIIQYHLTFIQETSQLKDYVTVQKQDNLFPSKYISKQNNVQ